MECTFNKTTNLNKEKVTQRNKETTTLSTHTYKHRF